MGSLLGTNAQRGPKFSLVKDTLSTLLPLGGPQSPRGVSNAGRIRDGKSGSRCELGAGWARSPAIPRPSAFLELARAFRTWRSSGVRAIGVAAEMIFSEPPASTAREREAPHGSRLVSLVNVYA